MRKIISLDQTAHLKAVAPFHVDHPGCRCHAEGRDLQVRYPEVFHVKSDVVGHPSVGMEL